MSLEDRTNEEIPLAMPGQGTLSVDIDSDSHVWPEPWVWLMFDGGNEHWARLTLEEAGKLHDRLGLILGRAQPTPPDDDAHHAHSGHRFGGGYARASAMLAGDPDWMNATGGEPAEDVPGGCIYCSSSGVIEDHEGDRPCSNCDGTGTPRPRGTVTDVEPSDAQVLAGLNAELPKKSAAPSLDFYGGDNIGRMRRVLREAAREARS